MAGQPLTIQFRGLDKLQAAYRKRAGNIKPELTRSMQKAVNYVWGQMGEYPPTRPGQKYVRTGQLGRSIYGEVRPLSGMPMGVLGTNLKYAKWVIDEKNQAWMHRGRWWTMQGKINDNHDAILEFFSQGFRNALGI